MDLWHELRNKGHKPKERVSFIANAVRNESSLLAELVACLGQATPVERGLCMEVIEELTRDNRDNPGLAAPFIPKLIPFLTDPAPKARWETARVVGNLARTSAEALRAAIPALMKNTADKGTVVRWSAAVALTQLALHDKKLKKELLGQFLDIIEREQNSGVRNVYLNALKVLNQ